MKVKELLAKLATCNPEADVIIYSETSEDADTTGNVKEFSNPQEAAEEYYCKGADISEICQIATNEIVQTWKLKDGTERHQYKYVNSENPIVVIS